MMQLDPDSLAFAIDYFDKQLANAPHLRRPAPSIDIDRIIRATVKEVLRQQQERRPAGELMTVRQAAAYLGRTERAVYRLHDKGVLQSYTVNNLGVGRSVDEALRIIQAYQFVAQHGEVCPANWKPGDKTMKADPKGSQEYFNQVK